ncbi:hypothetical protein CPB84DRAFT_1841930 [Gymnopilus junonius]|uniref:3-oxoacyl-[acyl-carrier-protein] reductase n=1 Tax=Gymnopilus junonius TaxID=109634 RepID=A0A9P5NYU7_GYMJU|nr:hypothetical protein CPB84DRAFT_1841930 [Gymnopilus junonius]
MTGAALVTGASRGIGRAIALRLAKDGYDVAINDLVSQQNELERLRAEIMELGKASSIFIANVSVEKEVESMISAVVDQMGTLDVPESKVSISASFLSQIKSRTQYDLATPMLSGYSSTKFAVRGLTQAAAIELAKYKITVNAYAPGAVDTLMIEDIRQTVKERGVQKELNISESGGSSFPLGRDTTPDEIAGLVSYLVSKDAAMVTGMEPSLLNHYP